MVVCERMFRRLMPQLYHHLNHLGVKLFLYSRNFFCTLFLKCAPKPIAVRIWDGYLAVGDVYLFRALLSVLRMNEAHLLQCMDMVDALQGE